MYQQNRYVNWNEMHMPSFFNEVTRQWLNDVRKRSILNFNDVSSVTNQRTKMQNLWFFSFAFCDLVGYITSLKYEI